MIPCHDLSVDSDEPRATNVTSILTEKSLKGLLLVYLLNNTTMVPFKTISIVAFYDLKNVELFSDSFIGTVQNQLDSKSCIK